MVGVPGVFVAFLWVAFLAVAFLFARIPSCIERGIVALMRRQWRTALLAVGGITLPFALVTSLSYLLKSNWLGGGVDPAKRAAVLAVGMTALVDACGFGLLFGLISWPFVAFLRERRASTRRRVGGRPRGSAT
jgi:hypothetical protein